MNKQEIFNTVATHLLTQNKSSIRDGGRCLYRGPDGLKCAIGVLIKDEYYSEEMEGNSADAPFIVEALINSGISVVSHSDTDFLYELQEIHDVESPDSWLADLENLATLNGLDTKVLDGFKTK